MIARIWRTQIDAARADEYQDFARLRSLPMFRAQQGFAGVIFARNAAQCAVITLWRDRTAVDALNNSQSYKATVREIEAAGFLRGVSTVEVFDIDELFLEHAASGEEALRLVAGIPGKATRQPRSSR